MPKKVWITALVPIEMKKEMTKRKDINWSEIIRMAIRTRLEEDS